MKIYTSYFAKQKQLEENNIFCVGICAIPPVFFKGPNFIIVAPTKDILFEYKNIGDKSLYIKRYNDEVLSIFKNAEQWKIFIDRLESISHGKDVALLCYEKPGDFCHRHLLADKINEVLGLNITEFQFVNKEPESYTLF